MLKGKRLNYLKFFLFLVIRNQGLDPDPYPEQVFDACNHGWNKSLPLPDGLLGIGWAGVGHHRRYQEHHPGLIKTLTFGLRSGLRHIRNCPQDPDLRVSKKDKIRIKKKYCLSFKGFQIYLILLINKLTISLVTYISLLPVKDFEVFFRRFLRQ